MGAQRRLERNAGADNLGVGVAGASAALTGLLFVSLSINRPAQAASRRDHARSPSRGSASSPPSTDQMLGRSDARHEGREAPYAGLSWRIDLRIRASGTPTLAPWPSRHSTVDALPSGVLSLLSCEMLGCSVCFVPGVNWGTGRRVGSRQGT